MIASSINESYEMIAIDSVTPHPRNPRRGNTDAILESIEANDFYGAIVAQRSTGHVLAGNHRLEGARRAGMTEIPAIWIDCDDERALRILLADNRTNDIAGYDDEGLAALLNDILSDTGSLLGTGYDQQALDELMNGLDPPPEGNSDAEPKIDQAEELRKKWGVETGQIWTLGNHRLMCGDSTSVKNVGRLLGGAEPGIMVTDPPYGVEYDPTWRMKRGVSGNKKKMGKVENDNRADWTQAWDLFRGDVAYIWCASLRLPDVFDSVLAAEFVPRSLIIWSKDRFALGRGDYQWQHEPCLYSVRKGATAKRTDDRTQSTVWNISARDDSGHGHSTQKPVECMARPIRNHDHAEIYEPFSGSGTTIIACENLRRRCFAMEISPGYVAVAIQRWADATGGTPKILNDG